MQGITFFKIQKDRNPIGIGPPITEEPSHTTRHTDLSRKQIGSSFKKYHATAIYAINSVEKELKQKSRLYEEVNYLSKKIEYGDY